MYVLFVGNAFPCVHDCPDMHALKKVLYLSPSKLLTYIEKFLFSIYTRKLAFFVRIQF